VAGNNVDILPYFTLKVKIGWRQNKKGTDTRSLHSLGGNSLYFPGSQISRLFLAIQQNFQYFRGSAFTTRSAEAHDLPLLAFTDRPSGIPGCDHRLADFKSPTME
jgi:hypothetical protein